MPTMPVHLEGRAVTAEDRPGGGPGPDVVQVIFDGEMTYDTQPGGQPPPWVLTHPMVISPPPQEVPHGPDPVPPPTGGGWGWVKEFGWGYFPGYGAVGPPTPISHPFYDPMKVKEHPDPG